MFQSLVQGDADPRPEQAAHAGQRGMNAKNPTDSYALRPELRASIEGETVRV